MSAFTWTPTFGSEVATKPRVNLVQFGDGYEQRIGDGINTMPRTWTLVFNVDGSVGDAIDAFLRGQAGLTAFDWTPPTGAAGKWKCGEWKRVVGEKGVQSVSATFVEVFE